MTEATTPPANTPTGGHDPRGEPPRPVGPPPPPHIKLDLPVGAVVATPRNKYQINAHLANSGSSKVYLVTDMGSKNRRVIRVEYSKIPRCASRIRTELAILESLKEVPRDRKSHLLALYDKGKTEMFRFIVVMLMGPTLLQIREKLLEQDDFTEYTAFYIALGTLQAIRDLHLIDYVHRDINLGKFAVGLGTYEKQIFMYNLKDVKKFVREDGSHIKKVEEIPFQGSLLFGSRNAMLGGEQSRRDDMESWIYMIFDVFDRQTFSAFFNRREMKEYVIIKRNIMNGEFSKGFFKKIPRQFAKICTMIGSMAWDAEPDYAGIKSILQQALPSNELRRDEFLDWTGKIEMRDDLKETPERTGNVRKMSSQSRGEIKADMDWSSKSGDGSTAEDSNQATIPKEVKRGGGSETSRLKKKSTQGRKKASVSRKGNSIQRKKSSMDKSTKGSKKAEEFRSPSSENVEAEGKNGVRTKGARRYKGSRSSSNGKEAPALSPASPLPSPLRSRERCLEQEPSSNNTTTTPSRETTFVNPSKESENGAAPSPAPSSGPATPSKESTGQKMTAAENKKHAEKLHRQMHINVTDTTEEDIKFNFLNDKKKRKDD